MKSLEKIIGLSLLIFAIGWNLWAYHLEPTAKLDPNDNTFQFALVDRTNQIWTFAEKNCHGITKPFCSLSYLTDHWVPNWAQGYNLPYYYSHVPQIVIVSSWRLFQPIIGSMSLFTYYHWVIYLLLSIFPLSVFLALRVVGLSWIPAGLGAAIATHLSTDGLYGLDPASFLWRGYGLSSQLFAMIWLPLSLAYLYREFISRGDVSIRSIVIALTGKSISRNRDLDPDYARTSTYRPQRDLALAILFLAATTAGHLGIGIMGFMSAAIIAISLIFSSLSDLSTLSDLGHLLRKTFKKLILLYGGVFLLLGYWILPILLGGNYHNISVWDPIWKFNSYGFREVLKNLFNGDLLDFGRFPILSALMGLGFFCAARGNFFPRSAFPSSTLGDKQHAELASSGARKNFYEHQHSYFAFSALFLFWLLLYFGRTTWGGLIDLIPGMKDFHLSRFIVGVHIVGLFLIPIGLQFLLSTIKQVLKRYTVHAIIIQASIALLLVCAVYPQTLRYSKHNDFLIKRANSDFAKVSSDTNSLITKLQNLQAISPGRVYFGRGGNWGKNFKVAETPYYLYASTYGIPIILWLPQTWSPNSDTEQYFSDDRPQDYTLYNVRYVVTSPDLPKDQIRAFWKPLAASKTWILYSVIPAQAGIQSSETDSRFRENDNGFGYITTGVRSAIVSIDKENFTNLVHLWIQSDYHKQRLYPELTFDSDYPKSSGLPNFRMMDEVTYKVPGGSLHNLFAEAPSYQANKETIQQCGDIHITSQKNDGDMIFTANVEKLGNAECLVVLRQSFHPSWKATIDGKSAETITVFPFYTAVKLETPGKHEVVFSYRPSGIKVTLLLVSLVSLISFLWFYKLRK